MEQNSITRKESILGVRAKKKMGCKADGEVKYRSNLLVVRILTRRPTKQTAYFSKPIQVRAKKKMGCKANGEVKYRSNLLVVRFLTRRPTKQTAYFSPSHLI